MSIEIVQGTNQKPGASIALTKLLSRTTSLSGQLFIGYPIIGTSDGPHKIDALLVMEDRGIAIFDLIEGDEPHNYDLRQDDSANKLEAKLRLYRNLVRRRQLLIPIHTVSFAPSVSNLKEHFKPHYPIANGNNLISELNHLAWEGSDQAIHKIALSAIESISTIRQPRTRREIKKDGSRGAKLKRLENSIATLDTTQSKAVIETVEGVQRIRGLAGSGKTIVLALKAAYLHAQHPDWRIAVTFNTRSLKGFFYRLINNLTIDQTNEEPDWKQLRIVNAWGAPGKQERDGIYYEFCRTHEVEYLDYRSARNSFPRGKEFSRVCSQAMEQATGFKQIYDAILVDEAQDFDQEFLRLCYALLKNPKRLIYAYDELQNLSQESLPSPDIIFRDNKTSFTHSTVNNSSGIEPRQDIILERCYRNSRPVLVTAHALGFGVYRTPPLRRETGLIQMFDNAHLWTDVGYHVTEGELRDGQPVSLKRNNETSPRFLEDHSHIDDLIQFKLFETEEEQADWLVRSIRQNLEEDELRPDDIMVINPDPVTTRKNVGLSRRGLFEIGVKSHLAGVDTNPDTFFLSEVESITFTGVYRAKGNEAGMVYVINAQDCHSSARNLASIRNRLFTAITRSKAWIRVLGVGSEMEELMREFEVLKEHGFELHFTYPDAEQREQLRIVHRDMSMAERKRLESRQRSLDDLIRDFESGDVHKEDLSKQTIAKLRKYLGTGEEHADS